MATAPIWLAKREKLRDSRNSRNDLCLSRSPAPTGGIKDMFERWPSPRSLSMARPEWLPGIALASPAAILARGGFRIMLQVQSAFGVLALLGIAWALGENRR